MMRIKLIERTNSLNMNRELLYDFLIKNQKHSISEGLPKDLFLVCNYNN